MTPPIGVQRRFMHLGRVRLGEKGAEGEPRKLNTFRFTSASRPLLEAVAGNWGGTVSEWSGAPDEGYYQVTTDATELPIILPPVFSAEDGTPTVPYSQFYELWSAGGCQRRCDGQTESLSGKPCLCDPENRECKITTRVNFMLPDVPGVGVWRLDSHGWNAAAELPGTLDLLQMAAAERQFIDAVLRAEERSRKQDGQTIRFIVPVIDLPGLKVRELVAGQGAQALNAPQSRPPRPELPATAPEPVDQPFENDQRSDWGASIPIPGEITFENDPVLIQTLDPTPEDQAKALTMELLDVVAELGTADAALAKISEKEKEYADDPSKLVTWLRGQLTRARNKVAEKETA